MPPKLNTIFLSYLMKDIKSIKDIDAFCSSKKTICRNNKEVVCRKILQISGYRNLDGASNYCKIYKDLATFANRLQYHELSKQSYVSMTPELYDLILARGSPELHKFLDDNGYPILADVETRKKTRPNMIRLESFGDYNRNRTTVKS